MARKKKIQPDELAELDSAYQNMVGWKATPKKTAAPVILISVLSLILITILGVGVWLLFSDNWLTMPDVTVAGINMTGMTKREAKNALSTFEQEQYKVNPMTVTVMGNVYPISAPEVGVKVDVNKAINQAYRATGNFDLSPYITYSGIGVDALVTTLIQEYNSTLKPTTQTVEGTVPALNTPDAEEGQTLVLTLGIPEVGLNADAVRAAILLAYGAGKFEVQIDCSVIQPEIPTADALFEEHLTAPIDAVMDEKTFVITPETYGYSIDREAAATLLENANYGDTLRIPFAKVTPQVTEESILTALFQDILGECSTPYSGWDDDNRNTNLRLACEKIDGIILLPGETFSYNQTLGKRTAAAGWKPAASYGADGLTVDTYGGGICQGSTTLYNCVLQADLKINEAWPHGYISSYIEPGLDAMVNWGTADFRFTNNTNWPIKLEAYRRDGKMTMRIYGTEEKDYYVKMTYAVLKTIPYETVYEEIDPENNPKGYKDGQVIVTPYTGYRVVTYKNKYNKETNELIETKLERDFTYNFRNKVIVKFVTPEPPEEEPPEQEQEQVPEQEQQQEQVQDPTP